MKPKLSYCDSTTFALPVKLNKDAREFVDNVLSYSPKEEKVYLETKIRATHSGHLMNDRCYAGWGMKAGTATWFDSRRGGRAAYDKPILINHDLMSAPIGRVVMAEYIQLKQGVDWDNDWRRPDTGLNHGSGYIATTGRIFHKDSIERIMDGRYNTVSTRQVYEDVWCNLCGVAVDSDTCEHTPGDYYESEDGNEYPCYAVTGAAEYVEESYVNQPRQQNAITMSFRKIREVLQDSAGDAVAIIGHTYHDWSDSILDLRLANGENTVDLTDSVLPATSALTGRTSVAMGNKIVGAPDKVSLTNLEDAKKAAEELSKKVEKVEEEKKEEKVDITPPEATTLEKFIFRMKDKLIPNLEDMYGPFVYYEVSVDANGVHEKIESRDGKQDVSVTATSCGTLICDASEIEKAIKSMESRDNKDTLVSADKPLNEAFTWDAKDLPVVLSVSGRLKKDARKEVLDALLKSGMLKKPENEEEDMAKIAELEGRVKDLEKKHADATALADARELERKKLLDETVDMKAASLSFKALLVVDAEARLQGIELKDEDKKTKVENLVKAVKDAAELDAMVLEKVLANVRKVPVQDPKNVTQLVRDPKLDSPVKDMVNDKKGKDNGAGVKTAGKSLSDLDMRSEEVFGKRKPLF